MYSCLYNGFIYLMLPYIQHIFLFLAFSVLISSSQDLNLSFITMAAVRKDIVTVIFLHSHKHLITLLDDSKAIHFVVS